MRMSHLIIEPFHVLFNPGFPNEFFPIVLRWTPCWVFLLSEDHTYEKFQASVITTSVIWHVT